MIEVKNLRKKFVKYKDKKNKSEFYAVDNISFEAASGEILGIIGPNGAGKTTLLRMIAGIMNPTKGDVIIDEMEYKNKDKEIKKEIAFLSGNTKLYDRISPVELMDMCASFYDIDKSTVNKKIDEICEVLSLEQFKNSRIGTLSTGQTQRVGIARCLVHDPKYYILDEATSGLDIISSQVILDFMKKERDQGKTILYSTHYMEEAENICDRVIMIDKGKIVKSGTPSNIKKDTKTSNLRDAFFAIVGGSKDEN